MYIYIGADVSKKSNTYTEVFNTSNVIKIEKNSTFYISPKHTELVNKTWLNVEAATNG
jgi:hypothetical protein